MAQAQRLPVRELPPNWEPYWRSYVRARRAEGRSERTLETYLDSLLKLSESGPAPLTDLRREDLERFMADLRGRGLKPASLSIHFRALRAFFNWLVAEEELERSPMQRMRPPRVPEEPLALLSLEEMGRMLTVCAGRDFESRRDLALLRLLVDTGARLGGVTGLRVDDLDLDHQAVRVVGKGGDEYGAAIGFKSVRDLDRYLRVRAQHPEHDAPWLWLGQRGRLTRSGVYQVVRRRARQAGIRAERAVHVFRHSFSHHFRMAGGEEGDLQELGGWKSRAMLGRYGRSGAQERARQAHRKFSPGDRI